MRQSILVVLPNPKRVAVLVNENCYSSAEYFVFYAKQNRKITLFGNHTGGVVDYGNVRKRVLNCPDFSLRVPTTRTGCTHPGYRKRLGQVCGGLL